MRFIFLPLLCLALKVQKLSTLNCFVDYKVTMNCTWRDTSDHSHVILKVYVNRTNELKNSCVFTRLQPIEEEGKVHTYFCTMKFKMFMQFQSFNLILSTSRQPNVTAIKGFRPSRNIQVEAPHHLSVTRSLTKQNVNISWKMDASKYLNNMLEYELEYWSKESREDIKVKNRINDIRHLVIEEAELNPDSNYTARVHGKPVNSKGIQGIWSTWSPEIKWRTDPVPSRLSIKNNLLFVVFAPLLLAIVIFISLYFKLPSRVLGKMWIRIPTPASFFQPLYHQHNGNFKEWIHKDQASNQYGCSGKLSQDLREVKRLHVSRGVTVVLSPWDEAVSNISNLKPIAINHALPFDMGTKSSLQTDSSNPFQYTPSLEYCHKSALDGLLPRLFQEEQHISENGTLCQDSSHGSFLGTMSQEEDEGYSYSDEYCTLAHSDSSRGLVPAKVGLQLKVSNKLQEEKREMAEDLAMIDDGRLPLFCLPSSSLEVTVSTGGPCQWETQQNPILGSDTSQTLRVTIKQ